MLTLPYGFVLLTPGLLYRQYAFVPASASRSTRKQGLSYSPTLSTAQMPPPPPRPRFEAPQARKVFRDATKPRYASYDQYTTPVMQQQALPSPRHQMLQLHERSRLTAANSSMAPDKGQLEYPQRSIPASARGNFVPTAQQLISSTQSGPKPFVPRGN